MSLIYFWAVENISFNRCSWINHDRFTDRRCTTPLGPIATKHWQPFIAKRFADAKKSIEKPLIAELCDRTQGHPFYTQHLCHVLWSMIEPGRDVNAGQIDQAVAELLRRESHAYVTRWESLTKNEQRFLRGLA